MAAKLHQIAAVLAIIAAPMPALAVAGPAVDAWIPGANIVEAAGSVNIELQPGAYNARDTYKVFVNSVAGKDLQLVVTGSAGVKVDYFDERRDNGLYAIFGAVDQGTMTLNFQTAPAGTGTWTTVGSKVLTVGARRTLIYDTADVPINVWWDAKGLVPGGGNPTAAQVDSTLDTDFANLKADGFNCVYLSWKAAWNNARSKIYENLTRHGMKVQQQLWTANAYVVANLESLSITRHNNVALLGLETALNTDMLTDVGGGVALKDHPQLWSYNQTDESTAKRGEELQSMLIKNLDPAHTGMGALQGQVTSFISSSIVQRAFSDFIVTELYPLTPSVAVGNFTFGNRYQGDLPRLNAPDNVDWARKKDLRRDLEVIVQAFGGQGFRNPTPKEMRAMVMMAASRGARPITYFIYGWESNIGPSLSGPPYVPRTATLNEAKLVNQKLQGWMPIYKNLYRDENGTKIPYTQVAASSGNLFLSDFESGQTTFGATNTTGTGHSGTRYGQMPADEILHNVSLGSALDRVPLFNSCVYTVWINDNGNANMRYRLGADIQRSDGVFYYKWGGYVNIGSGWQQLTLDFTPEAGANLYGSSLNENINRLFIQANTTATPVAYSIDDVQVTFGQPAYTPTYGLNGGVVGTFLHVVTGQRYIIVVNTDVFNTRTVAVNVAGNSGAATTAKDVDTGTVYNLTPGSGYGVLNISLAAGDGALLALDSGSTLISAVSRQTHGSIGTFDLPLPTTGQVAMEPRRKADAGNYSFVLSFSGAVSGITATLGLQSGQSGSVQGTVNSVTYDVTGTIATVALSGVGNAQRLNLHLAGIQPGNGTADIPMNVLSGDVNGDGTVNILDMGQVRTRSGQAVDSNTYKFDGNCDGAINILDIGTTRLNSGASLP